MWNVIIDSVREFAVNGRNVIRVDKNSANLAEDQCPNTKASYNDARDQTRVIWEPEPAMVHWNHIRQSIGEPESTRKEDQEKPERLDHDRHEIQTTANHDACSNKPKKWTIDIVKIFSALE